MIQVRLAITATLLLFACAPKAEAPQGLARTAIDHPAFDWVERKAPRLHFYFPARSYPAAHQDELIKKAEAARGANLELLGADRFDHDIYVFFIESRAQMDSLTGVPVTGLADRDACAVFLVNNPEWRAFERHEIMHVLAHHTWGPASGAWVEEGFAQFADGMCGAYTVDDAVHALVGDGSYVPMDTLVTRFRQLDDLTAYLQAASMMGFVYHEYGKDTARDVWQHGVDALPKAAGETPAAFAESWWRWVSARARPVPEADLEVIREKGCG
jgi:hypothetical protein